MPSLATDLPALGVQPYQVGPARTSYPFSANGDYATQLIVRSFKQSAASFNPGRIGVDTDALNSGDPSAYLIGETSPEPTGIGDLLRFTRTYARIPGPQVTYPGSRYITKPDYTAAAPYNPFDLTSGAVSKGPAVYLPTVTSKGNASYSSTNGLYTTGDGAIYTSIKTPTVTTRVYATAGTFTLTRGADTTAALAWNADSTTILAALNGLASTIADSVTFTPNSVVNFLAATTGGIISFYVTGGTEAARQVPVTMNAGGLTLSSASGANSGSAVLGSIAHSIYLPSILTINSHGLDTSKALAVCWGTTITSILPTTHWGSLSANTIWVTPHSNSVDAALVGTYSTTYIISSSGTYAGGSRLVRTRLVETFYLPGVSPGIATPADIPTSAGQQNPQTFLTNLLTPLTGWQTYDSEGPAPWLGSPIHRLAVTEVKFEDLV